MNPFIETEQSQQGIARLHYLTQDHVSGFSHALLAEMACLGGVRWVQLRVKGKSDDEWERIARRVKQVTDAFGATLMINDHVQLAKKIGAHGVHLGKTDMPIEQARDILGADAVIGGTANNEEDLERLLHTSANYIGLGPYRFTSTKKNLSPVLSAETLERMIRLQSRIPVIVIGGIKQEDVPAILASGAYGVAVSSAINLAEDKTVAAERFCQYIKEYSLKEYSNASA